MIVETPEIDIIPVKDWLKIETHTLGKLKVDFDTVLDKHIWITAEKIKIPVKNMTTNHIKNCINCLHGLGKSIIPDGYLGGKEKWLSIFNKELVTRQ